MNTRHLGKSKLKVSALGLGCWGMSGAYGAGDRKESIATIHKAFDLGITFIDTADIYGNGHNEELVGEAIKGIRSQLMLATKFGFRNDANGVLEICGHPTYVKQACEASLKRLGTDHIDLYYLHRLDKQIPIEETVGALARLIDEGKIGHIGLSEVSVSTLKKANDVHPITAIQSEYSMTTREFEAALLPFCIQEEIGIVPFCPLGRGLLTGALQNIKEFDASDYRAALPRFQGDNLQKNQRFAQQIIDFAKSKDIKPSQLALAWLLHQGDQVVPIPGMKTRKYLAENLSSVNLEFSAKDLEYLNAHKPVLQGDRYPEANSRFLDI